jgi:hypothetical protein
MRQPFLVLGIIAAALLIGAEGVRIILGDFALLELVQSR